MPKVEKTPKRINNSLNPKIYQKYMIVILNFALF